MDRNFTPEIMLLLSLFCLLLLQAPAVAAGDAVSGPGTDVRVIDDSWDRNPFGTNSEKAENVEMVVGQEIQELKPVAVRLNGIMEVNGSFVALVNDRQVIAGDTVDGILIRKIDRKGIFIKDENGSREILMSGEKDGLRIISRRK